MMAHVLVVCIKSYTKDYEFYYTLFHLGYKTSWHVNYPDHIHPACPFSKLAEILLEVSDKLWVYLQFGRINISMNTCWQRQLNVTTFYNKIKRCF